MAKVSRRGGSVSSAAASLLGAGAGGYLKVFHEGKMRRQRETKRDKERQIETTCWDVTWPRGQGKTEMEDRNVSFTFMNLMASWHHGIMASWRLMDSSPWVQYGPPMHKSHSIFQLFRNTRFLPYRTVVTVPYCCLVLPCLMSCYVICYILLYDIILYALLR